MTTRAEFGELLKEARLTHYALLALCAALLALMPKYTDLSDIYKLAEEDTRYAQGILNRPWEESHTEQRDKFERLDHIGITKDRRVFLAAMSTGLSMSLNQEIVKRWPEEPPQLEIDSHLPFVVVQPSYVATMKDLRSFYAAPPLKAVVPDVNGLAAKLRISLPTDCTRKPCKVEIIVSGTVDQASIPGSTISTRSSIKIRRDDAVLLTEDLVSSASIFDLRGPDFSKDFNEDFPYLRQVFDQVSSLTPEQSLLYLESKRISSQETLTFLGISIPQSMRIMLASMVCVVLAIFRAHVLRIYSLTENGISEEWSQECNTFPWFLLYPDRLSAGLRQLTLFWLPTVSASMSCAAEMLRLGSSRLPIIFNFVVTGACFFLSASCNHYLAALVPAPRRETLVGYLWRRRRSR